jgi:hypothetical protein
MVGRLGYEHQKGGELLIAKPLNFITTVGVFRHLCTGLRIPN